MKVHEALQISKIQKTEHTYEISLRDQETNHEIQNSDRLSCNEYEPSIHKRVLIEGNSAPQLVPTSSKQMIPTTEINSKSTDLFGIVEFNPIVDVPFFDNYQNNITDEGATTQQLLSDLQIKNVSQHSDRNFLNLIKDNTNDLPLNNATVCDQTEILKSINKLIDENLALKQSLKLSQEIISIYQTSLGGIKDVALP